MAVLDPREIPNGTYTLQLTAWSIDGSSASGARLVSIDRPGSKIGEFELSFDDLTVPIGNLPITIRRTYNTNRAAQNGDFGHGWKLDILGVNLKTSVDTDVDGYAGFQPAFKHGSQITVTMPDGSKENFLIKAVPVDDGGLNVGGILGLANLWELEIESLSGTKSTLSLVGRDAGGYVSVTDDGGPYDGEFRVSGIPFHPGSRQWEIDYQLRLRDGTVFLIDGDTGELTSIRTPTGGRISVTNDEIAAFDGNNTPLTRIQIERNDPTGRITKVIDPKGHEIVYQYDNSGDLVSVTNRENEQTTLYYSIDENGAPFSPAHFLSRIEGPGGVRILQATFTPDGKLESLTDGAESSASFTYDLGSTNGGTIETVTNNGTDTQVYRNARGDVERRIERVDSNRFRITDYETTYHDEINTPSSRDVQSYKEGVALEVAAAGFTEANATATTTIWQSQTEYDVDGSILSVTDALGNVTNFGPYDAFGNPEAIEDPLHNTTYNLFNPETGQLVWTKAPDGSVTELRYDTAGNLEKTFQLGIDGALVTMAYNAEGRLHQTQNIDGHSTFYSYDDNGNLASTSYFWDDPNTPIIENVEIRSQSIHDNDDRLTSAQRYINDTLASTSQTSYDDRGQVESTTDENGGMSWTIYDLRGLQIASISTAKDNSGTAKYVISQSAYDNNGRLIASTDPYEIATTAVDPENFTGLVGAAVPGSRTTYDLLGRVVATERLQSVKIDIIQRDPNAAVNPNELQSVLDPLAQESFAVPAVSTTVYDDQGRVKYSTTSLGARTDFYYDVAGRQIAVLGPVVRIGTNDNIRGVTTYVYDATGRLLESRTNVAVDIDTLVAADLENPSDPLRPRFDIFAAIASTDEQITNYQYDAVGRQTAAIGPVVTMLIDGQPEDVRIRTETVYDKLGRRVAQRENIFQVEMAVNDSDVLETTYEYDDAGRLAAVNLPAVDIRHLHIPSVTASTAHPRYEYGYDQYGNQTRITTNALLVGSAVIYLRKTAAGTDYVAYQRSLAEDFDPARLTDTTSTVFTYDAQHRQITRTLPLGVSSATVGDFEERWFYSDEIPQGTGIDTVGYGQLAYSIDFEGRITSYLYDNTPAGGGRQSSMRYYGQVPLGQAPTLQYLRVTLDPMTPSTEILTTYDTLGRVVEVTGPGVRTASYDFDEFGQLDIETLPEGTIHYDYDDATGLLDRLWTDDSDLVYDYDSLGRMTSVNADTASAVVYTYDLVGNLNTVTTGNASQNVTEVVTDYDYDRANRLVQLTQTSGGATQLAKYSYQLDLLGRRTHAIEEKLGQAENTTIDWFYDDLGRLVEERFDGPGETLDYLDHYQFDLVGNRLRKTHDTDLGGAVADPTVDRAIQYFYDDNDRLLREVQSDGVGAVKSKTFYEYDDATTIGYGGSQTQLRRKTITDPIDQIVSEIAYSYNDRGRLEEVSGNQEGGAAFAQRYAYNHNGIRIEVRELDPTNGSVISTSTFLIAERNPTGYAQVLEETKADSQGTEQTTYLLGHDVVAQTTAGVTQFLLADGHGSTRALVDTNGAIISGQQYDYDAYGNPVGLWTVATAGTSLLYSGEWTDIETSWQYLRARFYDPNTGRFNRVDPFTGNNSDPQSLHKYLYVHAEPVGNADPSGLVTIASVVSSINARAQTFGRVTQAIGRAYTAVDRVQTAIETIQFLQTLSNGNIYSILRQQINNYLSHFRNNPLQGARKLFSQSFWSDAAESMSRNALKIANEIIIRPQLLKGIQSILNRNRRPRIVLLLPIPDGIPFPFSRVIRLPISIDFAGKKVGISVQLGRGPKKHGTVWGISFQPDGFRDPQPLFRMDYHNFHRPQPGDSHVRWQDPQDSQFHFHVYDQI
ncbi:MAG: RHS repeat-associated core domain-containing protein [Planctomycetales bacterium]|nr:RHS repeat-associated core domain-containing protein [Planctomycetales bacterium]